MWLSVGPPSSPPKSPPSGSSTPACTCTLAVSRPFAISGVNAAAVNVLLTKRASPSGNGARPASSVCRRSSAPLVGTSGWSTVERA